MTNAEIGTKNLKPLNTLPPEEAFAIRSAGGKATAKAAQRRRSMRELAKALCECQVPDGDLRDQLEQLGLPTTMGQAIVWSQAAKAVRTGDTAAAVFVRDTSGEKPGLTVTAVDGGSVQDINLDELSDADLRGLIADAAASDE